jgi:hypothetical protein
MTVQDILAAASQLSEEERLQVAIRLLESLRASCTALQPKSGLEQSRQAEPHAFASNVSADIDSLGEKCSLHDLLSQSPFHRLDFEAAAVKSPVRAVEF